MVICAWALLPNPAIVNTGRIQDEFPIQNEKTEYPDVETWPLALDQTSSVISLKQTLFETSVISLSQQLKNVLPTVAT
jgi:hypothetical protein